MTELGDLPHLHRLDKVLVSLVKIVNNSLGESPRLNDLWLLLGIVTLERAVIDDMTVGGWRDAV